MRGNCRTSGELRRKEGGNVFGLGSRTPISITLLVKKPGNNAPAKIQYRDIGDYFNQVEKLQKVKDLASLLSPEMQLSSITPNEENDWLNQRDDLFDTFIPIVAEKKYDCSAMSFFILNTRGLETSRDSIVYSSSQEGLSRNVHNMIAEYNAQRIDFQEIRRTKEIKVEDFVRDETKEIIWTRGTRNDLDRNIAYSYDEKSCRIAMYRPFFKQFAYFSSQCNEYVNQWPKIFPTPQTKNLVICVSGVAGKTFSTLITDCIADLHILESGTQCFPFYYYKRVNNGQMDLFDESEGDLERCDGISDFILNEARNMYGPKTTKEDVFFYIYGLLHSDDYRARFAADLTKMLPRLPLVEDTKTFKAFSTTGRKLANLHIKYEEVPYWPDAIITGDRSCLNVEKMRFAKTNGEDDKRTIIINPHLKVENIPLQAYDYVINGKSAIEWLMERYSYTIHAESKITNDPNAWGREHNAPGYIIDLLLRIITVSIETIKLTAKLPSLTFPVH